MNEPAPEHYSPEGTPTASASLGASLGAIGLGLVLALGIVAWGSGLEALPAEQSTPEPVELPSFEGARTVYVITKDPSPALLDALEEAHNAGTTVQMVSGIQVYADYRVSVVDAERIPHNAVLIDGMAWHPLPDTSSSPKP